MKINQLIALLIAGTAIASCNDSRVDTSKVLSTGYSHVSPTGSFTSFLQNLGVRETGNCWVKGEIPQTNTNVLKLFLGPCKYDEAAPEFNRSLAPKITFSINGNTLTVMAFQRNIVNNNKPVGRLTTSGHIVELCSGTYRDICDLEITTHDHGKKSIHGIKYKK